MHGLNLVHIDIRDVTVFVKDGLWFLLVRAHFGSYYIDESPEVAASNRYYSSWMYDWFILCIFFKGIQCSPRIPYTMRQMRDSLCENAQPKSLLICCYCSVKSIALGWWCTQSLLECSIHCLNTCQFCIYCNYWSRTCCFKGMFWYYCRRLNCLSVLFLDWLLSCTTSIIYVYQSYTTFL